MKYYIGIDVSKRSLDVDYCVKRASCPNDVAGIKQVMAELSALQKKGQLALVVCEATGGYEQKLARACHEANLPVHVAHANKVRYFAKAKGMLAKTDKIDAGILSEYGRLLRPCPDVLLLSEDAGKIRGLLKRREQLQADQQREKNRLDKITSKDILKSIKGHINWLDKKIKGVEKKLASFENAEAVEKLYRLLVSIPSVGKLTAYYLLSFLPEIGKLSNKALAALVGVAPYNQDSGNKQGKRFIYGGRGCVRRILYMAGLTAIRHNPDLKSFYLRLREVGKPAKSAITAVMRKLIALINSVVRRGTIWQETCPVL